MTEERSSAVTWRMYAEERADIHDFLTGLTPQQWNSPSLCEGWRIRDVAVHLLVDEPVEQLGLVRAWVKLASFGFSIHRVNDWWIARNRDRPLDSIVAAFAGEWHPGPVSARLGPQVGMRASVIHHQDMRRPLGLSRVIAEERVRAALDCILTPRGSTNLGSLERADGLHFEATDIDWSWGEGLEVDGPAEAILMAVAGRRVALADLAGGGVEELGRRLQGASQTEP